MAKESGMAMVRVSVTYNHTGKPKNTALPTDVWVETVTYKETRNYLRNVIACYVVYQHRLGRQPTLDGVMRPVGKL